MKVLMRTLAARLQRLSPSAITAIGLCSALALGIPDSFTPGPVSFVIFHVLVVVFVGWGAGKWNAVVVSGVAVATMATVQWCLHGTPCRRGGCLFGIIPCALSCSPSLVGWRRK